MALGYGANGKNFLGSDMYSHAAAEQISAAMHLWKFPKLSRPFTPPATHRQSIAVGASHIPIRGPYVSNASNPSLQKLQLTAENMKKIIIDMSSAPQWVAFAITGVLTIPPVELGLGPNMWLIENPKHTSHGFDKLFSAVEESFKSFNLADHTHLTLDNVKVILIPMKDTSPKGIKVALDCADAALSIFNKMVPMTHTRLISWHR